MQEEILIVAKAITGAEELEETLLEMLCEAAEQRLTTQLREGVTPEDCGSAFPCAAALLAAADLCSCRCGTDAITSFTAGDLSIQGRDAEKADAMARGMRETARAMMAPYTTDGAFCFRGVQG